MNWEQHAQIAHDVLDSGSTPTSEALISLIKAVNPTRKTALSDAEKERGYALKHRLQNVLLENYGGCFSLVPDPDSSDIALIKHIFLPSIDACHVSLRKLSIRAIDAVSPEAAPAPALSRPKQVKSGKATSVTDTKSALAKAEQSLEEYDYDAAETILTEIRISDRSDIPALLKAARMLAGEMGLFEPAIGLLEAQPRQFLKDREIRELLACTYHGNGNHAQARAYFDGLHPEELGKESLFACADIAFKDGDPSSALRLLELAERSVGFATGIAPLRAEVEAALVAAARPLVDKAVASLENGDLVTARSLADLALLQYPHYREAGEVVVRIESINRKDGVAALWEDFEKAANGAERLRILGQLREAAPEHVARIAGLIAAEKDRQKVELIESRLDNLRRCLGEADWSGCFDILRFFADGGRHLAEGLDRAVSVSPLFSVLHRNERLDRLQPQQAKKRWLELVTVTESLAAGRSDVCFDTVKELREYFDGYRLFEDAYDHLLKEEQEKVRREIRRLLGAEGLRFDDLSRTFGRIRAMMGILPEGERAGYATEMSELHDRLKPAVVEKVPVHEYFDASLLGLNGKGSRLQEKIPDRSVVAAIDAEISNLFRIDCAPLTLTFSEDLPLDLEAEDKTFTMMGTNSSQVLLREDAETLVLIDLREKRAARYHSVLFRDVKLCDSLPDSNSFLFIDYAAEQLMLRATLSPAGSRFTSLFMPDVFSLHRDDFVLAAFMSGMEDTHYYLFTEDIFEARAAKCIKQCLDGTSRIVKTRVDRIGSIKRLRSDQDAFMFDSRYGDTVFNHNLAHKVTVDQDEARVFAYDSEKLYLMIQGKVLAYDHALKNSELLAEAKFNTFLYKMAGFTPTTGIALQNKHDGNGFFHRISDGHLSQLFRLDRVIWTPTPSSWYYCDYQTSSGQIRLRELHPESDDLFQWTDYYPKYTAAKEDALASALGDESGAD